MTNEAARVLEDALRLPVEERAEIADELLATLYDYQAEVEAAWAAEIERRVADARANPDDSVEWREVLSKIERDVLGR
ncbi:MAG TPA: addiction module protein [Thermoanaerobaculia bacterium]|jgi:putative addiction module component (TIGR02574 family)|nr:addiction module protein [Thermoanaerobaculia bacterium]